MPFFIFIALLQFASWGQASPQLDPKYAKEVDHCALASSAKEIFIFKQWHLSPKQLTTHGEKTEQAQNLESIYNQLSHWIESGELTSVASEGCEGSIDAHFTSQYNGWSLAALEKKKKDKDFSAIATLVPLKLEAFWGAKIKAQCIDDLALLQDSSLTMSDLRGTVGFLSRLVQYKKDPAAQKGYLEKAIEIYKLKPGTSGDQAIADLKTEAHRLVAKYRSDLDKRNHKFAAELEKLKESKIAFVVGGSHAPGLKELLTAQKVNCTVIEPVGYKQNQEEPDLALQLENAIDKI